MHASYKNTFTGRLSRTLSSLLFSVLTYTWSEVLYPFTRDLTSDMAAFPMSRRHDLSYPQTNTVAEHGTRQSADYRPDP